MGERWRANTCGGNIQKLFSRQPANQPAVRKSFRLSGSLVVWALLLSKTKQNKRTKAGCHSGLLVRLRCQWDAVLSFCANAIGRSGGDRSFVCLLMLFPTAADDQEIFWSTGNRSIVGLRVTRSRLATGLSAVPHLLPKVSTERSAR